MAEPQQSDEYPTGDFLAARTIKHHVVMFSSGAGSAVAGKRVVEKYGAENVTLLFADVNGEHPDNYRFLHQAAEWVGGTLVILDNDGQTIWDVFKAQRFLGNTRVDLCSRVLKREPMRAWLEAHHEPELTVVHLGFDISEEHRIIRAAPHWEPWRVEAPLCWEPVIWKDQALATLVAAGIEPPLLTRQGFPHANCGGGCVKAGIGQFRRLLTMAPDTYTTWEREEQAMREFLEKDVSILRDRRGGTTVPLTLRALRERIEAEDHDTLLALLDVDEGDSCNCMGDYSTEPVPVTIRKAS